MTQRKLNVINGNFGPNPRITQFYSTLIAEHKTDTFELQSWQQPVEYNRIRKLPNDEWLDLPSTCRNLSAAVQFFRRQEN